MNCYQFTIYPLEIYFFIIIFLAIVDDQEEFLLNHLHNNCVIIKTIKYKFYWLSKWKNFMQFYNSHWKYGTR